MALADRVTERVRGQRLINLTDLDDPPTGAVDTVRLGLACDDVEAAFKIHGVTGGYDETDARHVKLAVDGVLLFLANNADGGPLPEGMQEAIDKWEQKVEALGRVTGRDRIVVQAGDHETGRERTFKRSRLNDLRLAPPGRESPETL